MPIQHKFLTTPFQNGFYTENAILKKNGLQPQIMFIGTFNPATNENDNPADIFYGRNWFWPTLFNLFNNNFVYQQRRDWNDLTPTLAEILQLTEEKQITFTDLVREVLHNNPGHYELNGNIVTWQGHNYNLFKDADLISLQTAGQLNWNTPAIVEYINETPSINTVYFTRTPGRFAGQWNFIQNNVNRQINYRRLFTPSAQSLPGVPRHQAILKRWLNDNELNYENLDHHWLEMYEVNIPGFVNDEIV